MHLLSEFRIDDIHLHSYFSSLPIDFFDLLHARNIESIQTMQYLYVDESWSASQTLINFGAIIGSLSLKNRSTVNQSISLTLARKDLASASLAKKGGFVEISESRKHNVPVGLLVCFEVKPYPQEEVNQWADYYWKNKETYVISDNENQIINFKPNKAA